jgi:hypothetical protein
MLDLCLAPIILAGAMLPISTEWHHSALDHSPMIEAHTCYTAGIDYGFTKEFKGFEFSAIPQAGISYVDHQERNLPARRQYELGVQAMVCYSHYCSAIGYLHMSNGRAIGLCPDGAQCRPNIGEDVLTLTTGLKF